VPEEEEKPCVTFLYMKKPYIKENKIKEVEIYEERNKTE
jgi:hypothetical protein